MEVYISIILLNEIFFVKGIAVQQDLDLPKLEDDYKDIDKSIGLSFERRLNGGAHDHDDDITYLEDIKKRIQEIYESNIQTNKSAAVQTGTKSDLSSNVPDKDKNSFRKVDDVLTKDKVQMNKVVVTPQIKNVRRRNFPLKISPVNIPRRTPAKAIRRRIWLPPGESRKSMVTPKSILLSAQNKAKLPSFKKAETDVSPIAENVLSFKKGRDMAPRPGMLHTAVKMSVTTPGADEFLKDIQEPVNLGDTGMIMSFENIMRQKVPMAERKRMLQEEMHRRKGYRGSGRRNMGEDGLNLPDDIMNDPILKNIDDILPEYL